MKKAILPILFVFLFTNLATSQGCFPDGITFSSQEQVDQFPINYPECSIIEGSLIISGDNIVNLDSLYQITEIEGDLQVNNCHELTSVSGLSNIESVYGINFFNIKRLKDIDCFGKITSLQGELELMSTDSILNISSFQNITSIGGGFRVSGTKILEDLSAFQNLETIQSSFVFSSNDLIKEVSGFNQTDSLFLIYIGSNKSLKKVTGFQNLKNAGQQFYILVNDSLQEVNFPGLVKAENMTIESNENLEFIKFESLEVIERLKINDNKSLHTLNSIPNLDSVNYILLEDNKRLKDISGLGGTGLRKLHSLTIRYNDSLESFSGFDNLKKITNLTIKDGRMLAEFSAFQNLDSVTGDLVLDKLKKIESINAFQKLKYVGGEFNISFGAQLKNCANFSSLNYIKGNFTLLRLDSIFDLNGFDQLNVVGGTVTIQTNNRLESLEGFNNLESVVGDFVVLNNHGLVSLDDLDSLKTLSGSLLIENCRNLKEIASIKNLEYTGGISLIRLDSLKTIYGFPKLNTLDGSLFLKDLDKLKELSGFSDINKINKSLGISGCDGLKDFNGLETLKMISQTLTVYNCDSIKNLIGMENLSKIGNHLYIANNERLSSLQGINNADLESVEIKNNPLLSMCSVESICQFISTDYIRFENNSEGCNTEEEINEMCYDQGYYSDDVFSMINEQPKWNVLDLKTEIPNIATTQSYNYTNDFVFCGNRYSKINFEDINKRAYIRANHEKAYYRNREDCNAKEYLLYDYTLAVGDTAYVGWNQYEWIAKDTAAFAVTKVEDIEKFDRIRIRVTLEYAEADAAYTGQLHWLEGVGCEEHPFYPFAQMDDYLLHKYELLCFDSAGFKKYQSPNWSVCDTNYTSIDDLQTSGFSISPNPFVNQMKITSENEEIQGIQLLSLTGQFIPISWNNNGGIASVRIPEESPNGIYILRIFTANGYSNIKMVKSDYSLK
ncbi:MULTISPECIES: T9SS type A sorting domain-containing protein [unclassified Lentimicrobium]|uniref:T9SS type A sorting domain-containing protein n=1 Tax=unclassified Lentimicrobium TaxID=2677434 RepID=UPI001554EB18|nr:MULTISPECIES: T9SS type A sorting domain-containing protein [unclassified Lentimicrobium]NPD44465.1 T9SS type A sorting domain-containing protein [Lentimicrobium sp. S6]NPD84235.1 T9SS type A sorting domain-containing protein [Lentimicrobium sp. L6]